MPGADLVDEDGLNDSESESILSSPSLVREMDANLVLSDTNIKQEEGVEEESPSTFEKKVVENESEDMDNVQNKEDQSFSSIEHQSAENAQLKEINAELMRQVEKLRSQINGEVHILNFDVRDKKSVFDSISSIPDKLKNIDVLINNAGNAHGMDFSHEADLNDWDAMIDSNVKGLMYVTKALLPIMTKRNQGQIINMGSIAGFEVYPKGNIYCASKFAVDAFTKGLRIDLNKFNIRVCAIHPGLVETEFSMVRFKGDVQKSKKVYKDIIPLNPFDVANAINYMINVPLRVTISDLTILATDQANATIINRK